MHCFKAHICIQQTALELADKGHEVYVLADGVSSINHKGEVRIALDRMRQAGVFVTTSESFLFSAVGASGQNCF
jgi:nicotinamidase-related amidase